jgi:hypothetical protein
MRQKKAEGWAQSTSLHAIGGTLSGSTQGAVSLNVHAKSVLQAEKKFTFHLVSMGRTNV